MSYLFGLNPDDAERMYNLLYGGSGKDIEVDDMIRAFYDERLNLVHGKSEHVVKTDREFILSELDKLEGKGKEPTYNYGSPDDVYSSFDAMVELGKAQKRITELEQERDKYKQYAEHNQRTAEERNERVTDLKRELASVKKRAFDLDKEVDDAVAIINQQRKQIDRLIQSIPIQTPKTDNQPPRKK